VTAAMTVAVRMPLRHTLAGVVAYEDPLRSEARGRRTPAGRIAVMLKRHDRIPANSNTVQG
jgi:hypothetical protein